MLLGRSNQSIVWKFTVVAVKALMTMYSTLVTLHTVTALVLLRRIFVLRLFIGRFSSVEKRFLRDR